MKVLAIESSAVTASVAIMTEDTLIAEYTINYKKTHSQTLLPMIDEICRMTETDVSDIDIVAVSDGPGSFTGLRIGAATGKGIALAKNKPMVAVPTLEAMAYNLIGDDRLICPVMDARRKHLYTGLYRFNGGKLEVVSKQCLILVLPEPAPAIISRGRYDCQHRYHQYYPETCAKQALTDTTYNLIQLNWLIMCSHIIMFKH